MVFVIGLGRSGTNLVGHILASHPKIKCDLEVQPQFNMAINTVVYGKPIAPLISLYRAKKHATKKLYATKDHPNIWLVEQLRAAFHDAKFICIERDVHQVVASSLYHPGVLEWVTGDYPVNPLSANHYPNYENLNTIERLTLRWLINRERIRHLQKNNKGDMLTISFNDLMVYPTETLTQVQRLLGLREPFELPYLQPTNMSKWIKVLSPREIANIQEICHDENLLRLSRLV